MRVQVWFGGIVRRLVRTHLFHLVKKFPGVILFGKGVGYILGNANGINGGADFWNSGLVIGWLRSWSSPNSYAYAPWLTSVFLCERFFARAAERIF